MIAGAPAGESIEDATSSQTETIRHATIAELRSCLQNYDGINRDYDFQIQPMLFSFRQLIIRKCGSSSAALPS